MLHAIEAYYRSRCIEVVVTTMIYARLRIEVNLREPQYTRETNSNRRVAAVSRVSNSLPNIAEI